MSLPFVFTKALPDQPQSAPGSVPDTLVVGNGRISGLIRSFVTPKSVAYDGNHAHSLLQ